MIDDATATTQRITAVALSAGESQLTGLTGPRPTLMDSTFRIDLIYAPPIPLHRRQTGLHKFRCRTFIGVGLRLSHLQGVGAQHHLMSDGARGSSPGEVDRTVLLTCMEIVVGGLRVGS